MCGIAGFAGTGSEADLGAMIATLKHRGPDDIGVSLKGRVGFAQARLAIVDLSPTGHQPMFNDDAAITITFNGEIYNYRELREELIGKGIVFRGTSDTEVIIRLYESYGEESFARLHGMFAFALHDARTGDLYIARDRFGEKPLYWTITDGTLVFASEPKALFKHPLVKKEIDPQGVISYFTYDAVLSPQTMFRGIHKLDAATYGVYRNGAVTMKTYWHPPQKITQSQSFDETLSSLDTAFEKSVASQMVADVPVGVYLSGGLDSAIVAYYAQKSSATPLKTFSLGFQDATYDESSYARTVAQALGTDHYEKVLSAQDLRDALFAIVPILDEPIADPALLPNYLLAQFAREHVTVALGGDGGDELFAGYQTFDAEMLRARYQRVPSLVRRGLIEPVVRNLPVSHRYFSFDFKARQFLRGADAPERYMHQRWLESFNDKERAAILSPQIRAQMPENPYARIDEYLAEVSGADTHLQAAYYYLRAYMQEDILSKVDRTSMMHALEVRAPFLDVHLAEIALRMPYDFKYNHGGKYILKKLMEDRLPAQIINRKKHGFGVPVGEWFRSEWKQLLTETLAPEKLAAQGIFVSSEVQSLITQHANGSHNHRKRLWSLFMFQLWYDATFTV